MANQLEIVKTIEGDKMTLTVGGRIDTVTAPQLEESFKLSQEGMKEVIFDFSKLDYISSAGLRVLLSAQKTMNKQGTMTIMNVNEDIMEIFEVTGFVDILKIV